MKFEANRCEFHEMASKQNSKEQCIGVVMEFLADQKCPKMQKVIFALQELIETARESHMSSTAREEGRETTPEVGAVVHRYIEMFEGREGMTVGGGAKQPV
ncbi:hypothetical protein C8R44DRAFT_741765 [Mycena epipterygia]|nr:hypothetical protein C8R44DRAFT_741765 [Mycena epipterygia]